VQEVIMGHATKLWGYIDADEEYAAENASRIAALPSEDERQDGIPLFTREMFSAPQKGYLGQLMTFGRYYNGVETRWTLWREAFEALLRTLEWNQAHVWLETDLWGDYHCWWQRLYPEEQGSATGQTEPHALEWRYHGPLGDYRRS
jgi:hypothetical protein